MSARYEAPSRGSSLHPEGEWQEHSGGNESKRRRNNVPAKLRLPLLYLCMVVSAFTIGSHVGYERALDNALLLSTENADKDAATEEMTQNKNKNKRKRSSMELIGEAFKEQRRSHQLFRQEYASVYGSIFDKVLLRRIFVSSTESHDRLVRRIMIKVLVAQLDPEADTAFVWATGGDSAAAGHGNMLGQSYTTVLQDTVRDAFASVGVTFVARNHAMGRGGMLGSSSTEMAVCMESVYGKYVDVLGWDFGLTEGGDVHRTALWGNRAALHATKPILFMVDSIGFGRWDHFVQLEEKGVGAVLMDKERLDLLLKSLPDATEDSGVNHNELPPALKFLVCKGEVEGMGPCDDVASHFICGTDGGGICRENKFIKKTDAACNDVRYQTVWNPGWKQHLLKGRLLGAYILEMLNAGLIELDALMHLHGGDRKHILTLLQQKEALDAFLYETSPAAVDDWQANEEGAVPAASLEALFRDRVVCRTALMPSQQRLALERGASSDVSQIFNSNGTLAMAFDPRETHQCPSMIADENDFFYVQHGGEGVSTIVPSAVELDVYQGRTDGKVADGLIMMCFRTCVGEGECPETPDGSDADKLSQGSIRIQVDGVAVTGSNEIDGCHFLEGDGGMRWRVQRSGTYKLQIRIVEPTTSMRISSMAVFFP